MSQSSSYTSAGAATRNAGEARGRKVGLHQPSNDKQIADKLENVD